MKPETFEDLSPEDQESIDGYLDGTIDPEAFEALQDRLTECPSLRRIVRRYQAVTHSLQSLGGTEDPATRPWIGEDRSASQGPDRAIVSFPFFLPMAAVAALAFLLGLGLMHFSRPGPALVENREEESSKNPSARGFAVMGRAFEAVWPDDTADRQEGDMLGTEDFELASGMAEIQFFSGATMTVEGPARISIQSAWEATCHEGSVRMQVPPAARGFTLHGPATKIVDLGTEFGLVVRDGQGHVEVFDGEILVRHQDESSRSMKKGAAIALPLSGPSTDHPGGKLIFPDEKGFRGKSIDLQRSGFTRWQSHRDTLAADQRLIAYYTFEGDNPGSLIPNLAVPRDPETSGTVILAEPVAGRWPGMKESLEFRRPGSRVRVKLPGEFSAFTFLCWVRVDSLDRQYNALLMGDGYETGEPHWQIREDGRMMLSVMVDDSRPHPKWPGNRFHTVYFSPPIWDLSMSGKWLHLASVFDPGKGEVSHYVDGNRISREEIEPEFLIRTLRIDNAEIGNWGQPFRQDPTFAIRNLNGRMDEIAIFKAALDDKEIRRLFEQSQNR